jgi:hypothetical protein
MRFMEQNRDFGERSLLIDVEKAGGFGQGHWRAPAGDPSTLRLVHLAPERLAAEARLAVVRPLATSVYQDGGWRLLVGGRPLRMALNRVLSNVLSNGPFVGAWLPAGTYRLEMLYRPRTFLPACLLAALAAALGLLVWMPPPATPAGASSPSPAPSPPGSG